MMVAGDNFRVAGHATVANRIVHAFVAPIAQINASRIVNAVLLNAIIAL